MAQTAAARQVDPPVEVTIKKSVTEVYRLEGKSISCHDGREYVKWVASVYIDEEEGRISVQSTYGNYTDMWSRAGRGTPTLKEFLSRTDDSYIMQNFGKRDWFDKDRTLRELKLIVLASRRKTKKFRPYDFDVSLDKDEARECWEQIERANSDDFDTADRYWNYVYGTYGGYSAMAEHFFQDPHGVPCYTDYDPTLKKFMKEIWTHVRNLFKEITDESKTSESNGEREASP